MAFDLDRLRRRVAEWRGTTIERDLTIERSILAEINGRDGAMRGASTEELRAISHDLRARAKDGAAIEDLRVEAYALVREIAHRVLGQRPFDVQALGAIAMHLGKVVEMQTGEGKTLAAVMPTYLRALAGHGAHVLTFNDYLAERDAPSGPGPPSVPLRSGRRGGFSVDRRSARTVGDRRPHRSGRLRGATDGRMGTHPETGRRFHDRRVRAQRVADRRGTRSGGNRTGLRQFARSREPVAVCRTELCAPRCRAASPRRRLRRS